MAVRVRTKKGKTITLLSPREKGRKYSAELKAGIHATNTGRVKKNKSGKAIRLTDTQKAYRSGYLTARKDIGKAAQSKKHGKKSTPIMISYKG